MKKSDLQAVIATYDAEKGLCRRIFLNSDVMARLNTIYHTTLSKLRPNDNIPLKVLLELTELSQQSYSGATHIAMEQLRTKLRQANFRFFANAEFSDLRQTGNAVLAEGNFGKVCRNVLKKGNQAVAIKRVKPGTDSTRDEIDREIAIYRILCPLSKVVNLFGALQSTPDALVMELMLCSLEQLINNVNDAQQLFGFDKSAKTNYVKQVLEGLVQIHQQGVVHFDIKAENLLINTDKNVKYCDFGLARVANSIDPKTFHGCGTPQYTAPELFTNDATVFYKCDVYSVAILIAKLILGRAPYSQHQTINSDEVLQFIFGILRKTIKPSLPGDGTLADSSFIDLLKKSWVFKISRPDDRDRTTWTCTGMDERPSAHDLKDALDNVDDIFEPVASLRASQ